MPDPSNRPKSGVDLLIEASRQGRNVIPLVGAGISVSSGIPAISGLVRYLAKVKFYLDHSAGLLTCAGEDAKIERDDYFRALGWPDPHQLDEDLWMYFERLSTANGGKIKMSDDLIEQAVQMTLREALAISESGLVDGLDKSAEIPLKAWLEGRQPRDPKKWKKRKLGGDWKSLLNFVTGSDPARIDSLFRHLTRDRIPAASHRSLAALARLMDWKMVLTINFDTLIEEAMREEGLRPDVYEVSNDADLPHASLLRERLSVVKLHGGMYGLTVGERLDQPMDEESKSRIRGALEGGPLILILGWGGADRRVMDLIRDLLRRPAEAGEQPSVLWVHYEPTIPDCLQRLIDEFPEVKTARTHDLAEFLREAHDRLANAHAPSLAHYPPVQQRPLNLPPSRADIEANATSAKGKNPRRAFLFAEASKVAEKRPLAVAPDVEWGAWIGRIRSSDDASVAMSDFVGLKAKTHAPIWVNAENHLSVGGVVAEIIAQVRQHDIHLSPVGLTTREVGRHALTMTGWVPPGGPPGPGKIIDREEVKDEALRVVQALRRGRYILAIDNINSSGRPPHNHHGLPREGMFERLKENRNSFQQFVSDLVDLMRQVPGESILCLALDCPAIRWLDDPRERHHVVALFDEFLRIFGDLAAYPHLEIRRVVGPPAAKGPDGGGPTGGLGSALEKLAVYRRPRSIVAIRNDLGSDDAALRGLIDAGWISLVEGGAYWMNSRLRDEVYSGRSNWARTEAISQLCLASADRADLEAACRQLRALREDHNRVARYYYASFYLASHDVEGLSEYFYHRIASLRLHTHHARLLASHPTIAARLLFDPAPPGSDPPPLAAGRDPVIDYHRLRLDDLVAFRSVLEREQDALFSHVSADVLYFWIVWLRDDDLGRLKMEPGSAGTKVARIVDLANEKVVAITGLVERAWFNLLREKTEFAPCIRVASDPAQVDRFARHEPELELLKCYKDKNDFEAARTVADGVRPELEAGFADVDDKEADKHSVLNLKLMLLRSDLLIAPINHWQRKAIPLGKDDEQGRDGERAIEICLAGLDQVRSSAAVGGDSYFRNRAYFHSIKARSHGLRMEFAAAHADLDRAAAGLSPGQGSSRQALAVIRLRRAEIALIESDHHLIVAHARATLGRHKGGAPVGPADLSDLAAQFTAPDLDEQARASRLLDRGFAFWGASALDVLAADADRNFLRASRKYLDRAGQALAAARALLIGARRNIHWWRLFHQITAQHHFESLMLLVTRGPRLSDRGPDVRFHLEATNHIRLGLRSIRDALASFVRTDPTGPKKADPREQRLIQLWFQFLIVGCAHEWAHHADARTSTDPVAYLLDRWEVVVGIERASIVAADSPTRAEFGRFLAELVEAGIPTEYGIRMRAFVARRLVATLHPESGIIQAIIDGRRDDPRAKAWAGLLD